MFPLEKNTIKNANKLNNKKAKNINEMYNLCNAKIKIEINHKFVENTIRKKTC